MTAPWGARPEDWARFVELGQQENLLPIVSEPGAKISPSSKMRDLGKTPSRYDRQGMVVGFPGWTRHVSSDQDIARWASDSRLGVSLQTREVRAIDIDIADPVHAAAVRELVELGLGALPMRSRSNSGKCLLVLHMPGDFVKRVIKTAHGIIEFLATGQQFVAVGTHPSGVRYEWAGLDECVLAGLPEVTPAEFETLWQALVTQFALEGGASTARAGMMPAVPRAASQSYGDPMVDWLKENNWIREFDRDGRVHIRCPWADGHSSDTPTSTTYFPAGVGGFSQGHWRCLHASCAGRDDGDFLAAVGYDAAQFDVVPVVVDAAGAEERPWPAFTRDRRGRIDAELNNVLAALRRPDITGHAVGIDSFREMLMLGEGERWRPFGDNDYVMLRSVLASRGFCPVSPELIKHAVLFVAEEHRFDSAIQWADSLKWDGVERIDTFYSDFFGVADTPYTRAVAAYTWTALAGRCLEPGAKCDMVPVFIGLQGAGKTTVVEALSPIDDAFVELNLERKDDDLARSLRGKLVGEIAELRGLQGRDAESIKAWISRRWEEWTPKWREFTTRFPRRLLMFGTGNAQGFLDDTEERRWLPMVVGTINVEGVRAAREQLWAEGCHRFKRAGVAWQQAYERAKPEHAAFKVSDPWADAVGDWLARDAMDGESGARRGDGLVRTNDVLIGALGLRMDKIDRRTELRIGKVLRNLGYRSVVRRDSDGKNVRGWARDFGDLA